MMEQSPAMNTIELDEKEKNDSPTNPENSSTNASDEEIEGLLNELDTSPNTDATATALEKLRCSTKELTSTLGTVSKNIDSKLHVTENAKNIDSKLGVSGTVTSTANAINSLWSSIQSSATTQSIQKTVGKGAEAIGETVDKSGLTERIQKLDKQHGITSGTFEVLKTGVDWVNQGLKQTGVGSVDNEGVNDADKQINDDQDYDKLVATSADENGLGLVAVGEDQVEGDKK